MPSTEEASSFPEQLERILILANRLDEEGELANSGERGYKAAHQRARRTISEMRKALPILAKLSRESQAE